MGNVILPSMLQIWRSGKLLHSLEVSDGEPAYTQALLGGTKTWIRLPRDQWPKEWETLQDPVCPLILALYGNPDAGGFWEQHCEAQLKKVGFVPIPDWPSVFRHPALLRSGSSSVPSSTWRILVLSKDTSAVSMSSDRLWSTLGFVFLPVKYLVLHLKRLRTHSEILSKVSLDVFGLTCFLECLRRQLLDLDGCQLFLIPVNRQLSWCCNIELDEICWSSSECELQWCYTPVGDSLIPDSCSCLHQLSICHFLQCCKVLCLP